MAVDKKTITTNADLGTTPVCLFDLGLDGGIDNVKRYQKTGEVRFMSSLIFS